MERGSKIAKSRDRETASTPPFLAQIPLFSARGSSTPSPHSPHNPRATREQPRVRCLPSYIHAIRARRMARKRSGTLVHDSRDWEYCLSFGGLTWMTPASARPQAASKRQRTTAASSTSDGNAARHEGAEGASATSTSSDQSSSQSSRITAQTRAATVVPIDVDSPPQPLESFDDNTINVDEAADEAEEIDDDKDDDFILLLDASEDEEDFVADDEILPDDDNDDNDVDGARRPARRLRRGSSKSDTKSSSSSSAAVRRANTSSISTRRTRSSSSTSTSTSTSKRIDRVADGDDGDGDGAGEDDAYEQDEANDGGEEYDDDERDLEQGMFARSAPALFDFHTELELKADHAHRPVWLCGRDRAFLETFSPVYQQAYDFFITIAEPICRCALVSIRNRVPLLSCPCVEP